MMTMKTYNHYQSIPLHSFKTITTGPNPYTQQQHKSADKLQCTQIEDSIMRVLHPFQREGVQYVQSPNNEFILIL